MRADGATTPSASKLTNRAEDSEVSLVEEVTDAASERFKIFVPILFDSVLFLATVVVLYLEEVLMARFHFVGLDAVIVEGLKLIGAAGILGLAGIYFARDMWTAARRSFLPRACDNCGVKR